MIRILLFLGLILLFSCGDGVPSNPVDDYKSFLKTELVEYQKKAEGFKYTPDYKVDVTKTDSLATPIIGTCDITIAAKLELQTEGVDVTYSRGYEITFTHGHQDGKWVLTKGVGKSLGLIILECKSHTEGLSDEDLRNTIMSTNKDEVGKTFYFDNLEQMNSKLNLSSAAGW